MGQPMTLLSVETPAQGSTVQVLSYKVKDNYQTCIRSLFMEYAGGSYNPGDFLFSITVNQPVGSTLAQGVTFKDYLNVPYNVGSRAAGPWSLMSGELSIFQSKDVIRVTGKNVNAGVGSPNFFLAALIGWTWPNA
jgi:hypothetical protein